MLKVNIQMFASGYDGSVTIGVELDASRLDEEIAYVKDELEALEMEYEDLKKEKPYEGQMKDLRKYAEEIDRTKDKLKKLTAKRADLSGAGAFQDLFKNAGKELKDIIKNVVKWGLAIFGVRTAYNAIRSAMSVISQNDKQLAADIDYMKTALAYALEPVVRKIVDLMKQLMFYVGYIVNAWFGINIFKNANKGLKQAVGSAKELKKQLAGFDEMNILGANTTASGGSASPSFDLSKIQGDVPEWIKWIGDNGAEVLSIIGAIGAALASLKIAAFIKKITGATTKLAAFKAGVALVAAGLVLLIANIVNMMLNWDKMDEKQKVLTASLAALGAAMIALGYAIAAGFSIATLGIGAVIAAIVAIIAVVGTRIVQMATEEKAIKSVTKAQEDLKKAQDDYLSAQDDYVNAVDNAKEAFDRLKEAQDRTGISGEELYEKVQNGTIDYANMTTQQQEVYKAYLNNLNAQDKLKDATDKLTEAKQKEKIASWDTKLAVAAEKNEYQEYKKSVVDAFRKGELSADEARDQIGKAMSGMSRDAQKTFMEDIPDDIKQGLDPKKYETTGQRLKKWFDELGQKIKNGIKSAWDYISSKFGSGGITYEQAGFAKGGVVVPKLASGGIINQPGRGVPLSSAIGGERGREGIIPLTDSQQMELLGEAIGKYITINANITNTMNGRVISRELQKVQNDSDFAYNR